MQEIAPHILLRKAMNHSAYVDILKGEVGKRIVEELCRKSPTIRHRYSDAFVKFWCLKEFIVRFDKGMILPDGRYERSKRIFDAILFVQPSIDAIAQKWSFKVGFEVKTNPTNLLNDDKIQYYLGWTDFFFIAVDDSMIDLAITKARADPRIGVASLTSGKIHKMPAWQDVPMGRRNEVMEQAFYRYTKRTDLEVSFLMNSYGNTIS